MGTSIFLFSHSLSETQAVLPKRHFKIDFMRGGVASFAVLAFFIVFAMLGETIFNKWLNKKFGPGSAEYYHRWLPMKDRNKFTSLGFKCVGLAFLLLLLVAEIIGAFTMTASPYMVILFVILAVPTAVGCFFMLKHIIRVYKAAESWFALPEEIQKQSDFDKYGSVAATLHEIKAEKIVYRKLAKLGDVGAIMAELEQYGETISGTNPCALRISPNYIMLLSDFGEDYIWERRNLRDFKRADNGDIHELKLFDGNEEITVSFHGDGAVIAFDTIIRACENA